ncbi:endonuclease/exonuclease/phosphatase family protein [Patescibacteria group bacterium]|nr:endonuclease/exonuclease/phosphatase family protein [Patescibacteria group bacterium]
MDTKRLLKGKGIGFVVIIVLIIIIAIIYWPKCTPDGCNGNCPANCTVAQDPDCGCKDDNDCCGIGCTSQNDNNCSPPEICDNLIDDDGDALIDCDDPDCILDPTCIPPVCTPDGCNGICPANCTVTQDPDCGCQNDNNCCGVECTFQNDNDCLPESTLRIAAFNIQIFGKTKREKEEVMNVLKKIAQEFDIMLVQEIRDVKKETTPYYLQKINEAVGYEKYAFKRSERLGRSSAKEAYAYFYDTDKVEFIENSDYIYNDVNDVFEREPYIVSFRSGNFDFTLVGIHVKPDDADSEIGHLANVVDSILAKNPSEEDIIVMGDFNADGSYFDENDNTNPFKASKFHWVITNDMDTMTKTDWTYDRMVMMDSTLNHEYAEDSAEVFYFDKEYGIDDETFVWEVSDHYPIYANFKTNLIDDD